MAEAQPPTDVTWEDLRQHAEASWRLTGPNSGGGTTLYRYQGRLFVVGYGDYGSLPSGAEQVLAELPDNTPGFAPDMGGGHAAGCCHDVHWDSDWWLHKLYLLSMKHDQLQLFERGNESWSCPLQTFTGPDPSRRDDVLAKLGPVVLDEAVRCAAARLRR